MDSRSAPAGLLLVGGLVACVSTWAPPEPASWHRTAEVEGDNYLIGNAECIDCHEEVQGYAPAPDYHADCESCHGPGGLHFESEEPGDIRHPTNADCADCHGERGRTLLSWSSDPHEGAGVLCSDCHAPHRRAPAEIREVSRVQSAVSRHAGATSRLCSSCHPDVAARFELPSHHPLREGMLECSDCHAPHGADAAALGPDTLRCTGCHQDVAGPWIHEHTPVAEDCGACHEPHGASNDGLVEPSQPGVCIQCHSVALSGAVHEPWAFTSACTECHSAVHGSLTDGFLRR